LTRSLSRWPLAALLLAVAALTLAACGDKRKAAKATPTKLAVTITEAGKSGKYTLPATVAGGLVTLTATNHGSAPHAAQLVRIEGGHTGQEALKIIASNSNKTPAWMRAQGGLGTIPPGGTQSAAVNLPAGKYIVADLGGGPNSSGPPGFAEFKVSGGATGALPTTPTTVDAAKIGEHKYEWKLSGAPLKAGTDTVTFKSGGKDALHLIASFRVIGNPSKAEIVKALGSQNGPPPKFVDQSSFSNTAALDGGLSQTTTLELSKPGRYVLFCPLTDREGGKSHDQEGLVTTVDVK
jgi:hypothetical protein